MATVHLAKRAQVAIETEGTAGTAETLVAADVTMRVEAGSYAFNLQNEVEPQDLLQADLSELPDLIGNRPVEVTFSTPLKGQGAVDTAPGWREIMIHAGFLETVTASTDVAYTPETPVTTASATVGIWVGPATGSNGRLYQMKGARCSQITISVDAGKKVYLATTWRGAFVSATDASVYSGVTYDATVPQTARSLGVQIGSWSPLFRNVTINVNNTLAQVDNPGAASEASGILNYEIAARRVEGTMNFYEVLATDKDVFADLLAGTEAAFDLQLGGTSSNIVTIDIPKFQFLTQSKQDIDDLVGMNLAWKGNRDSGDDEITITSK